MQNKNSTKWIKRICVVLMVTLICFVTACSSAQNETKFASLYEEYWSSNERGLHVCNGKIYLGKTLYYGVGLNCYSLFLDALDNNFSVDSVKNTFEILNSYDIKLIRFNCGIYYARELNVFFDRQNEYLDLIESIFSIADEYKIGLIPSFFWKLNAIPEFFGEEISSWGKNDSRTFEFMSDYTKKIVTKVATHKSAFAWEFGNEFMLDCDLPKIYASYDISCNDLAICYNAFADIVKTLDPYKRLVETGDGKLRDSQFNQWKNGNMSKDTKSQRNELLKFVFDKNVDGISEHIYEDCTISYLRDITSFSRRNGKAYVVGEWGAYNEDNIANYDGFAKKLLDAKIQLSFVWNYDFFADRTENSFCHTTQLGQDVLKKIKIYNVAYGKLMN